MISMYLEEWSMQKIALKLGRSTASIHSHIKSHNRAVERSSFCPACRRVHSEYESDIAKRG